MYFLKNQKLLVTLLVVYLSDVSLSAPQYTIDDNNDQQSTNNEGTTEIIQEEIIPINSSANSTFVPALPFIYPPPRSYNPFGYQPYFIPPAFFPNIPPVMPPAIPVQSFQPPAGATNVYLDYDENNNLISNSTVGFQPITDDSVNGNSETNGIQDRGPRFRQTTNNQTYVTPIKSIKKADSRSTIQESYIVAETFIRPNEKPTTIIHVYYDPAQKRDNTTYNVTYTEPYKLIEIESNIVNEHVVTNTEDSDGRIDNPTTPVGNSDRTETTTGLYSGWPFARFVPTEAPTQPPEETESEEVTPEETTPEEVTPETTEQISENGYEDVTTQTPDDVSDEEEEEDENYDEDQRDDYNAIVPAVNLKKRKINDKIYEQIPKKWLNIPTTEKVAPTTAPPVPIWIRQSNTTPKIFAFNYMGVPTIEKTTPKATNPVRGWYSWKPVSNDYKPKSWTAETTTERLRFSFFR